MLTFKQFINEGPIWDTVKREQPVLAARKVVLRAKNYIHAGRVGKDAVEQMRIAKTQTKDPMKLKRTYQAQDNRINTAYDRLDNPNPNYMGGGLSKRTRQYTIDKQRGNSIDKLMP